MSETIKDGTGTGNMAGVDSTNKLLVRSISEPATVEAAINGDNFIITTGLITLTSASASAVLYYVHNEDYTIILDRIFFAAFASTGGTTDFCSVQAYVNPTGLGGGTGTEAIAVNTNFGSSNVLDATNSEIGQEAATVTGGTLGPLFIYKDEITSFTETRVIIPKGSSIAFTVTPPAGNTSQGVSITLNVHKLIF